MASVETSAIAIPPVPKGGAADQQRFFSSIKQSLEVMLGQARNSEMDQVVRVKDLEALVTASGATITDDGDVQADTKAPGPPRGLSISAKTFANYLEWTNPGDEDLYCTEVWAAEDSQLRDDAVLVGVLTVPAHTFNHTAIKLNAAYTYWIRAVDFAGNKSPWSPPDAQGGYVTPPIVTQTVTDVLQALVGKIEEGQLHQDLNQRIDVIDRTSLLFHSDLLNQDVYGSLIDNLYDASEGLIRHASDIAAMNGQISQYAADIQALYAQVGDLVTGPWSPTTEYVYGNICINNGKTWRYMLQAGGANPEPGTPGSEGAWEESDSVLEVISQIDQRVDTFAAEIATKVSTVSFDILADTVTQHQTLIEQNAEAIVLKASKNELDAINERLTVAESSITASAGGIELVSQAIIGPICFLGDVMEKGLFADDLGDINGLDLKITGVQINLNAVEANLTLKAESIEQDVDAKHTVAMTTIDALNGAVTTQIQALTTNVATNTTEIAAAEERLQVVEGDTGAMKAEWVVKLNANGVVAGVGLLLGEGGASEFIIESDRFMVVKPGDIPENAVPMFVIGQVDGETQVGINGGLLVDGTIRSRMLDAGIVTAEHIHAGETFLTSIESGGPGGVTYISGVQGYRIAVDGTVEFNDAVLRGSVYIGEGEELVIGDPADPSDYVVVNEGEFVRYAWDRFYGVHRPAGKMQRVETGTASNGETVKLPNVWKSRPTITVSPNTLPTYNPAYASQAQAWSMSAANLEEFNPLTNAAEAGTGYWRFLPIAQLQLAAGAGEQPDNGQSGTISAASWQSAEKTTPPNTDRFTVSVQFASQRGTGVAPNYYKRRVRWKIGYSATAGGPYTWTPEKTTLIGATLGAVVDTLQSPVLSAKAWKYVVSFTAEDVDGSTFTSGSGGWEYNPIPAEVSHVGQSPRASASITWPENYKIATTSFSIPSIAVPSGWQIYRVIYAFRYEWFISGTAGRVTLPNGQKFEHQGSGGWLDGVWDTDTLVENLVATAEVSSYGTVSNAAVSIGNATAKAYFRKPIANSATAANSFLVQKIAYSLTGSAPAITGGVLNWLAIGE